VNLSGWKFIPYAGNGSAETTFDLPAMSLPAGGYLVLHRGTGTNTTTNLYMGNYATAWNSGGSGSALLRSGNVGIDFVRWGSTAKMPAIGTGWSGTNPAGPAAGQTLGRDPLGVDTDDTSDWGTQVATLGGVNQPTRPSNDNLANAQVIASLPYNHTLVTFMASTEASEWQPACTDIGRTVWYRYTSISTGPVSFNTIGSDFDTALAVWSGSPGALSPVACSEDIILGKLPQSRVVFTANAGTTYYIQVGGYNGLSGNLIFNATPPLANDDFTGAAVIAPLPFTVSQDTTDATEAEDDPFPSCNDAIRKTVWYRYVASASETVRLETATSDYDTVLSVWTGNQGQLTEIDCHDDVSGSNLTSRIDLPVFSGTTYHIMVSGGFLGESGNLVFKATSLTPPPPTINPPVLSAPNDGATVTTTQPKFQWFPTANATSYQIQLGMTSPPNGTPITVSGTEYTPPAPLLTTIYYWRVRSLGTGGSVSAWSAPRSLIVPSAPNAAPIRNFYSALPITLTWGRVDWAVQYEVQVDNTASFAMPWVHDQVVPATTLSIQVSGLSNGTYYWRVRARRANGTWGTWSIVDSFLLNLP
jgi:hypothetical protein